MSRTRLPSVAHLTNQALVQDIHARLDNENSNLVDLLIRIGEIDKRKFFVPDGYESTYRFCIREFRMSEDMALKRIRAARAMRRFPVIYDVLAEGRIHLTGLVALKPKLTHQNANELLSAAEGRTVAEIKWLLAERFPDAGASKAESPATSSSTTTTSGEQLVSKPVAEAEGELALGGASNPATTCSTQVVSKPVETYARLTPIAPEYSRLDGVIPRVVHEELEHARDLLGAGDLLQVLDRAVKVLVQGLEERKFGATDRPRKSRPSNNARHIPAHVRRAVDERDGRQCTFVSASGLRCEARKHLEYDHIEPVARGGAATVENIRLRCRTHNQYTAERTYGVEFMRDKREEAQHVARERATAEKANAQDVIPWLRKLGCSLAMAQQAAEHCANMSDAPLKERVRMALRHVGPRATHVPAPSGP